MTRRWTLLGLTGLLAASGCDFTSRPSLPNADSFETPAGQHVDVDAGVRNNGQTSATDGLQGESDASAQRDNRSDASVGDAGAGAAPGCNVPVADAAVDDAPDGCDHGETAPSDNAPEHGGGERADGGAVRVVVVSAEIVP